MKGGGGEVAVGSSSQTRAGNGDVMTAVRMWGAVRQPTAALLRRFAFVGQIHGKLSTGEAYCFRLPPSGSGLPSSPPASPGSLVGKATADGWWAKAELPSGVLLARGEGFKVSNRVVPWEAIEGCTDQGIILLKGKHGAGQLGRTETRSRRHHHHQPRH